MVAQTLAYAGDVFDNGDVEFFELGFGTDAGVHKDLGGVEGSGGEDDFFGGEVCDGQSVYS